MKLRWILTILFLEVETYKIHVDGMFVCADQANAKDISSEDFTIVNTFLQENIYIYITKEGKIRDKIDKIRIYVCCTNNMRKTMNTYL